MSKTELELRDYFAGQALPPCVTMVIAVEANGGELKKHAPVCAAEMAYQIADAMLSVRAALSASSGSGK